MLLSLTHQRAKETQEVTRITTEWDHEAALGVKSLAANSLLRLDWYFPIKWAFETICSRVLPNGLPEHAKGREGHRELLQVQELSAWLPAQGSRDYDLADGGAAPSAKLQRANFTYCSGDRGPIPGVFVQGRGAGSTSFSPVGHLLAHGSEVEWALGTRFHKHGQHDKWMVERAHDELRFGWPWREDSQGPRIRSCLDVTIAVLGEIPALV